MKRRVVVNTEGGSAARKRKGFGSPGYSCRECGGPVKVGGTIGVRWERCLVAKCGYVHEEATR